MTEQIHAKPQRRENEPIAHSGDDGAQQRKDAERAKADADALLDEIDALLDEQGLNGEAEAQEFVDLFVQKGGE